MGMTLRGLAVAGAISLAACSTHQPLPPALPVEPSIQVPYAHPDDLHSSPVVQQQHREEAPVVEMPPAPVTLTPVVTPTPGEWQAFETKQPPRKGKAKSQAVTPESVVVTANEQALVRPTRAGYGFGTSAVQRYPFWPGRLYEVYTSPNHPTTIRLPQGERLAKNFVPTLNKEEWGTGVVEQGEGHEAFHVVIVRPVAAGQEATTPLLTQSGKALYLRLRSFEKTSMAEVTWEPPLPVAPQQAALPQMQAFTGAALAPVTNPNARQSLIPPLAPNTARAYTGYTIKARGAYNPPFMPKQVWDDGTTTYVLFAQSLQFTNAPAVFAHTTKGGSPHLVQFAAFEKPGQAAYIVRGLWPRLELKADNMTVDIIRTSMTETR